MSNDENVEQLSLTTEEYLYQMEEDLQTDDLYSNGKKLRILKDLIEKQLAQADASHGRIKHHKVSVLAKSQLALYERRKQLVLSKLSKIGKKEVLLSKICEDRLK
jgi:hypothetical protein